MHSAPSTSAAAAIVPAHTAFHDNRKYSDTVDQRATTSSVNGQSNGQRPANKARRTSSGGSRVPGEDVGRRSGHHNGSSASDSGSDWPHGPKVHTATAPPPSQRPEPDAGSSSTRPSDKVDEQQASTSSSYFTSHLSRDDTDAGKRDKSLPHLDLAKYPAQDLLRILAALLAQIATANDHIRPKNSSTATASGATSEDGSSKQRRRDQYSSGQDSSLAASSSGGSLSSAQAGSVSTSAISRQPSLSTLSPTRHDRPTTAALGALETPSSTLCFHARNVPSISIESYLLRILKYCPATNEVFLSLLIYFDRMSKMGASASMPSQPANTSTELDLASGTEAGAGEAGARAENARTPSAAAFTNGLEDDDTFAGMKGFAIDSYNVHRLVIAGVTVASKFFSDVFYTNSRYAKVGGLPVHELNQLELQFLLLNDFRLVIPLEEMQRYADQLLVYGGVPGKAWNNSTAEGAKASGNTAATTPAVDAVSRQGQRDASTKEP